MGRTIGALGKCVVLALLAAAACSSPKRDFGPDSAGGDGGASGAIAAGGPSKAGNAGALGHAGSGDEGGAAAYAGAQNNGGAPEDACAGIVCDSPPKNDCASTSKFLAYDAVGTCALGTCKYAPQEIACECAEHACKTDPCAAVTCAAPPASICKDGNTATKFASNGTCNNGSCSYASTDTACSFGCANGACKADPCIGVTCASPPSNDCVSATKFKAFDKTGTCASGACSYAFQEIACTCQSHACTADPCASVMCNSPPAAKCKDANSLTTYASAGTCSGGSCNYAASDSVCEFGCANGACKANPCLGVTCNTPPGPTCKDVHTKTTYAASGTCSNGTCSYAPTDASCGSNNACSGSGICDVCATEASCGPTCAACGASASICKQTSLTASVCAAPALGCNTITQAGAIGTGYGTAGPFFAGTRGTMLAGTYVLDSIYHYGQGDAFDQSATLTVAVSGANVTLNAFQDLGGGYQYRWTASVLTTAVPPTFKYSCYAVVQPDTKPALDTSIPFDYSVINATTLELLFPDTVGYGTRYRYRKQ